MPAFCRQIGARTAEHRDAMRRAQVEPVFPAQMASILRQEFGSMVRVAFLLARKDHAFRNDLISAAVNGRRRTWLGSRRPVTDKETADLADSLDGWTRSVHKYGRAFIHLSDTRSRGARDPFLSLPEEEQECHLEHIEEGRSLDGSRSRRPSE
jgi:hypothetical protein